MAERSNANMMGATILGGLVGASLAILFAPRSGKETRQQIHQGVDQVKDEARQLKHRLREAAHNVTRDETDASQRSRKSPVLTAWEEEA